jgi:DNA-binding NarL/FixJ family response regulator
MSETSVDRGRGRLRAAGRSRSPRVLAYSGLPPIAEGVIELLPEAWRHLAEVAVDAAATAGSDPLDVAIIDLTTPGAAEAVAITRTRGASVILLLAAADAPIDDGLAHEADAVLLRDEVEERTLRMALAAGTLGLRVLPRALPLGDLSRGTGDRATVADRGAHAELSEPAQRALVLLAEGMRDAEIARELSLSESATRKLIQRTVRRAGARTRCQAVAAAVRGGDLL